MTRRGFALAAVLFALTLLAALTAVGFFSALQENRAGRHAASLVRASAAARTAIADIIAGWNPADLDSMPPGSSRAMPVAPAPGVTVTVNLARVSPSLFALRANAVSGSVARDWVDFLRLRGLDLIPSVAARVRGIDPALSALVSGVDAAPPGWVCPATSDTIAPLSVQSGASDSAFLRFGSRSWSDLVAWAQGIPAGGDSLKTQYWPHDLTLSGSHHAGLIVVEGDLTLDGGATIAGVAIVRGSVVLRGSGGGISGALVASQLVAAAGYSPSVSPVMYSSCAVRSASLGRAWPEQLPGHRQVPIF